MRGFGLIFSRDMRDLAGTTAYRVVAALLVLLELALAAGAAAAVIASPALSDAAMPIGAMLYFATLLPFLVFVWAFAGAALIKEKASGHLETLLATPLSPRTLWLAKSAIIALPGLAAAALGSALIAIAAAMAASARPGAAVFVLPPQLALVCFLGNPLLFTGLGALTVAIAFRAKADAAIIPSFALGFGLMAIVPAGTALGFIDFASWAFASAYSAAGALEWAIVLLLVRGMTKERIVLSSRED